MHAHRRRLLQFTSLASLVGTGALGAQTSHPSRAVRIIVPFPPGGAADALMRLMADKLAARWRQTVTVENKPGAHTTLGTDLVAKSPPDGHVVGIVTGSHIINPLLTKSLPYDTDRDLAPVMQLTRVHLALYAHPSLQVSTPGELLALARRLDGKLAYGSATTQSYLCMELLNSMAGVKMHYIAYKGSSQALNDVLGGHLPLVIDPILQSTLEHVKAGRLRLIGTLASVPSEHAPGTPVMATVVPGYDFTASFGLIARGGTPPELVRRLRDEFAAVMTQADVAARIRSIGQEYAGSTPEEYQAYIQAERRKWAPAVTATGATLN